MGRRSLTFIELDTGCFVCTSHRYNPDGYFRYNIGNHNLQMFHRLIWEHHNGPIPEGYEINHLCGNRCCQNVAHMECIPGKDHTIKTNVERYAERKRNAHRYWNTTGCSGTALGEHVGVSFSAACGWIREWSKETH